MGVKRYVVVIVGALLAMVCTGAAADDGASVLKIRSYDHVAFDTTTGTFFGIAGFYTQDNTVAFNGQGLSSDIDIEAATAELRLIYGGESAEFGVLIPYHMTSSDQIGLRGQDDIGDVRTYLKAVPFRSDVIDVGGGLMIAWPGGSEDVGISTGEIGVLPYASATVHAGPVDLNGHIGYEFINHHRGNGASESLLFGGAVKYPVTDQVGLRVDFAGQQFVNGKDRVVAAVQPGFEVLIPAGAVDVIVSVAGSYGLSGGTAGSREGFGSAWGLNTKSGLSRGEWGAGGAVGLSWN